MAISRIFLNPRDQDLGVGVRCSFIAQVEFCTRRYELGFPITVLCVALGFLDVVSADRFFQILVCDRPFHPRSIVLDLLKSKPIHILTLLEKHVQSRHGPRWKAWAGWSGRDVLHVVVKCPPLGSVGERLFVNHVLQPVQLVLLLGHLHFEFAEVSGWREAVSYLSVALLDGPLPILQILLISVRHVLGGISGLSENPIHNASNFLQGSSAVLRTRKLREDISDRGDLLAHPCST